MVLRPARHQLTLLSVALLVWGAACGDEIPPDKPPILERRARPEFLHVAAITSSRVELSWEQSAELPVDTYLERATDPAALSFVVLARLPRGETSFVDSTVVAGHDYVYRVTVQLEDWVVPPSDSVRCAPTNTLPPAPPTLLDPTTEDFAVGAYPTMRWAATEPDGERLTYRVYLRATGRHWDPVGETAEWPELFIQEPLKPRAAYQWRVLAVDPHGAGSLSPVGEFTTDGPRYIVEEGWSFMGSRGAQWHHPGNPVKQAAFAIDAFEVTNAQYAAFLNLMLERDLVRVAGGAIKEVDRGLDYVIVEVQGASGAFRLEEHGTALTVVPGQELHPVAGVSWYGADAYARLLGRRLPTEAEWEKSARGLSTELGDTTITVQTGEGPRPITVGFGYPYPWGANFDPRAGNFLESGDPYEGSVLVRSTPVGFYDGGTHGRYSTRSNVSPWGVYDLVGNVAEWTDDWFGEYRSPHQPPAFGFTKVVRGGGWDRPAGDCDNVGRRALAPGNLDLGVGFRTASGVEGGVKHP